MFQGCIVGGWYGRWLHWGAILWVCVKGSYVLGLHEAGTISRGSFKGAVFWSSIKSDYVLGLLKGAMFWGCTKK